MLCPSWSDQTLQHWFYYTGTHFNTKLVSKWVCGHKRHWSFCIKALALGNCNAILFYNSKNHVIIYTILFYNTFTSQTFILLKYYFLIFLYYFFSNRNFCFPRLSNSPFFSSLSPSTPVQHKMPSSLSPSTPVWHT